MTAVHIFRRRRLGLSHSWHWLWLWFLSIPCQALTLGDLAVSSSTSPSFTASLPFSDDKPVRLWDLQTRIATDAEYAQWGLQMPQVVRELRVRVIPASQAVGYVELYSLTPLSQSNFDLLVWASYAGQTMLTHYKVGLQDLPSLIKGQTLSTSQAFSPTWSAAQSGPKPLHEKSTQLALSKTTLTPAVATRNTEQDERIANRVSTSTPNPSVAETIATPTVTAVINGTPSSAQTARTSSNRSWGVSSLVLLFSVVLFLFGFLLGRQRHHGETALNTNTAGIRKSKGWPMLMASKGSRLSKTQSMPRGTHDRNTLHTQPQARGFGVMQSNPCVEHPLPVAASAAAFAMPFIQTTTPRARTQTSIAASNITEPATAPEAPTVVPEAIKLPAEKMTPSQAVHNMAPENTQSFEAIEVTAPPANNVASVTVVSRTPATALPTPRRAVIPGHITKARKTKSTGNANIALAKIYLSMGDPTTAQMVLQQVLEQGSEEEKVMAEQLIQEMV